MTIGNYGVLGRGTPPHPVTLPLSLQKVNVLSAVILLLLLVAIIIIIIINIIILIITVVVISDKISLL